MHPHALSRAPRVAAMRRAYHETGVSGGVAPDQYVGAKGKAAKRSAARAAKAREEEEEEPSSLLDDVFAFLEDEFWLLFFAILYAFSFVFFLLACAHKYHGSRKKVWTYVIVAFVPWTVGTLMYLIDPRLERWTLDALTKAYFRYQELRHKPEALAEEIRKWWRWRREYKPKRVFGV